MQRPPVRSLAPRRRGRTCLVWFLSVIVLLMIPMFICGMITLTYLVFPPPPTNILLVGMDSRGNEGALARTDSIMVVNVNGRTLTVNVLSIPRGLFVNVPDYGSQMINTVSFLGELDEPGTGMGLLITTIEQDFGIKIDGYIRMDFAGFRSMIDALGGVEIYVERVLEDYDFPTEDYGTISVHFDSGWQTMDGERALIYARTRHSDDDYRRAERQQQVVSAFVKKAINPLYWAGIMNALGQSVETNLPLWNFAQIAPTALLSRGRFNQLVINRDYIVPGAKGPLPDYDKIEPFLQAHFR